MTPAVLPVHGDVFPDAARSGRALRVSWHHEQGLVVLSLWREDTCVGTVRLEPSDLPRLIGVLTEGLAEGCAVPARGAATA